MEIQQHADNRRDASSMVLTSLMMKIQIFCENTQQAPSNRQPVRRKVPADLNLRKKEYQKVSWAVYHPKGDWLR
jgi:hypothetical protein